MTYALLTSFGSPLGSPLRTEPSVRPMVRVGLVQMRWQPDPRAHDDALREGVRIAAEQGAQVVCLPELTRSPYFAADKQTAAVADRYLEDVPDGPTTLLAKELASELGVAVHASLYERAPDGGLGYNTAICVTRHGELVARTRKLHIPEFPGYHEDLCFRPGDTGFPVVTIENTHFGFPTCWDEWFPLDQRRDWLEFGLLHTRRPELYGPLTQKELPPCNQ